MNWILLIAWVLVIYVSYKAAELLLKKFNLFD